MSQSGVEEYGVSLKADTSNYTAGMKEAQSTTDGLLASLTQLGERMGELGKSTQRKLDIVSAAQVATITGMTLAAGRLEQQMSQLDARNVMLGRTTDTYTKAVSDLRREYGMTSNEAIGLVTQMNKMSQPVGAVQKLTSEAVKLSAVTGESASGLAASQAQMMRQMQSAPGQVERYASMFATLGEKMGVSTQSTMDFANSIAPLSATLGMNQKEIAGISAAFTKAGSDGFAAANAYTKVLSDINRSVQYGSPEMRTYADLIGVTVEQFQNMPKAEVISEIFTEINKQGPQAIKTFERLGIDGVRSQRALQSVIRDGGFGKAIGTAGEGWDDTETYNKAAAASLDGLTDSLSKSRETLTSTAEAMGGVFTPAAKGMAEGLETLLSPLKGFADWLNQLPNWAKNLGTLGAALMAFAPQLPRLAAGMALLSPGAQLLRGPLAQGFRMGRNPNMDLTRPQQRFLRGEMGRGGAALFRIGARAGDLFNLRGARGILGDVDVEGQTRKLISLRDLPGEYKRISLEQALRDDRITQAQYDEGIKKLDTDREHRVRAAEARAARPQITARTALRNASIGMGGAIRFTGNLLRGQIAPLGDDYIRNGEINEQYRFFRDRDADAATASPGGLREAMRRSRSRWVTLDSMQARTDQLNERTAGARHQLGVSDFERPDRLSRGQQVQGLAGGLRMATVAGLGGYATAREGGAGLGESVRTAGREFTTTMGTTRSMMKNLGEEVRKNQGVFSSLRSEMGLLMRQGVRSAGGIALGAGGLAMAGGRAALGGIGRAGGALLGAMGGPAGLAITGGVVLGGMAWSNHQRGVSNAKAIAQGNDEDVSAGAAYRDALGEASIAALKFTDTLNYATDRTSESAKTVDGAIKLTEDAITRFSSQGTSAVMNQQLVSMSDDQRMSYASAMLRTASPEAAAMLSADFARIYGTGANAKLEEAYKNRNQSSSLRLIQQTGNPLASINEETVALAQTYGQTADQERQAVVNAMGERGLELHTASQLNDLSKTLYDRADEQVSKSWMTRNAEGQGRTNAQISEYYQAEAEAQIRAVAGQIGISDKEQQDEFYKQYRKAIHTAALENADEWASMTEEARAAAINKYLSEFTKGSSYHDIVQQAIDSGYTGTSVDVRAQLDNNPWLALSTEQRARVWGTELGSGFMRQGTRGAMGQALAREGDANAQYGGIFSLMNDALDKGGIDGANAKLIELRDAAGNSSEYLHQLARAAQEMLIKETERLATYSGNSTLAERGARAMGRARDEMNTGGTDSDKKAEDLKAQREALEGTQDEVYGRVSDLYMQFRNLDWQKESGARSMAYQEQRSREDTARQVGYATQDFERQQGQSLYQFNLQRIRGEADFERQRVRSEYQYALARSRQQYDFELSRRRGEEDYQRQRGRAEEDYQRSLYRQDRNRNISLERQYADYTRSRTREEQDFNVQMVRQAKDASRNVYDIWSRVQVARTNDISLVTQNLEDQNRRLVEQSDNLEKLRSMGVSNDVISQLNLTDSSQAQQLERLVQEISGDPAGVENLNKLIAERIKNTAKVVQDSSNEAYNRMREDREKQLRRQDDDFQRSLKRGESDYRRSLNDMNDDFRRGQNRQEIDFRRSMRNSATDFATSVKRMNKDYTLATRQQNEDFARSMERARKDFNTQVTWSVDNFNIQRNRQQRELNIGFANMRKDFAFQLKESERQINRYAEDISVAFDEAFEVVYNRTSGKTRRQLREYEKLFNNITKMIDKIDTKIREVTGVKLIAHKDGTYSIPGKGKIKIFNPMADGGPGLSSPIGPQVAMKGYGETCNHVGGPGDGGVSGRVRPLGSTVTSAVWGQKGGWNGSKTLGPGHHSGLDFPAATGTRINAVADGRVISTGWGGAYGNFTKIDHGGGTQSWYAHQSGFRVKPGDNVSAGQQIGMVGTTGRSTGPHLHLEIRVNGNDIDPAKWLKGAGGSLGGMAKDGKEAPSISDIKKWKAVQDLEQDMDQFGYFLGNKIKKGDVARSTHNKITAILAALGGSEAGIDYPGDPDVGNPGVGKATNKYGLPGNVTRWEQMVKAALQRQGLPMSMTDNFLRQINTESGGNPSAIQQIIDVNWPHNKAAGLMQIIPGTFAAYRDKELVNDRLDPWASLNAAARYIKARYPNSMEKVIGAGRGYRSGVDGATPGWALVGEDGPEWVNFKGNESVYSAHQSKAALQSMKQGAVVHANTITTNNTYDHSVSYTGDVHVHAQDPNEFSRKMAAKARRERLVSR